MGLFVSRPEEPTQWAGLPGEPLRPRTAAESLPEEEGATVPDDLLGMSAGSIVSVAIPLAGAGDEQDGADDGQGGAEASR